MVSPVLKWAGGKRRLLRHLSSRMPQDYNRYFEPFFGAGALYFSLAETGKSRGAVLSDANDDLMNLYRIIRDKPQELIQELSRPDLANNAHSYYGARDEYNSILLDNAPARKAALLLYLNRHCYNGLYRVNSRGKFNVPFGKYRNPSLPEAEGVLSLSAALQGTELISGDFETALSSVARNDFVYLDPPYHPVSCTSNFTDYCLGNFDEKEQERLNAIYRELDKRGAYVMQSNSDTPFIRELYSGYLVSEVSAARPINSKPERRGNVSELIITNYIAEDASAGASGVASSRHLHI